MRMDFRSTQRGYTLVLGEDLFGAHILYRHWFGLDNRRGGMKQQVFKARQDAMREIERIKRARVKHGYKLVTVKLFAYSTSNQPFLATETH